MEQFASKVMARTIASVQLPMEHFLKTGFWDPFSSGTFEEFDISEPQVRRACRQMSVELKRPFITCHSQFSTHELQTSPTGDLWVKRDTPLWSYGIVQVPKKAYLNVLVAPLMLAENNAQVRDQSGTTFWNFIVSDRDVWDKFYDYLLNDPDCRKARRLPA